MLPAFLALAATYTAAVAQGTTNNWPHEYPGKPTSDFSPAWQSYFEVNETLANVTFDLGRNFAGNIPVQRLNTPNNTLFFWGFERENGSLTAAAGERSNEPWGVWLNGGPGSSSMLGMFYENGPIRIADDYSAYQNNFSWNRLADYFWIDQPVGVGYSTVQNGSYVVDEDQMGRDFLGFLENLVKEQHHLCGYNLNFTYPQTNGTFPTLEYRYSEDRARTAAAMRSGRLTASDLLAEVAARAKFRGIRIDAPLGKRELEEEEEARVLWHRDLSGRPNGTTDPYYECFLFEEVIDYALNYSAPWNLSPGRLNGFDVYNVPDALNPEVPQDATIFLNDPKTRAALHTPTSKDFIGSQSYPFRSSGRDPSPPPMVFFSELATNATTHNVPVIIYSGNDDALVPHWGSEVTIQNTTFGGIQGFTRKPSTSWTTDNGTFAGIVHQERNWTYVQFYGAGHLVPQQKPEAALVFLREFVIGSNRTGLVGEGASVVGGEDPRLQGAVLPAGPDIYFGSGTTASTYAAPSATIAAWESFLASATRSGASASGTGASSGGCGTKAGGVTVTVLAMTVFLFVA